MNKAFWFNPHINNALRLSLGLLLAQALGFALGEMERFALAMLVLPAILVSALDQPSPYWGRRVALGVIGFAVASLSTAVVALHAPERLPLWFALLGVIMASFAAWGELSGRLGMGVLTMAVIGLATSTLYPPWQIALGFAVATAWLMLFSAVWYRLWRQLPLRQALAQIYRRLAELMERRPEQLLDQTLPVYFDDTLGQYLAMARRQLAAVEGQKGVAPLRNALMAAVDLQERLQAIPEPHLARDVLVSTEMLPLYQNWTRLVAARLLRISQDLKHNRTLKGSDSVDVAGRALSDALMAQAKADRKGMVAHYMAANAERITRLAGRAGPLYQRAILSSGTESWWRQWLKMMRWSSPVLRGGVRLGLILGAAMAIASVMPLDNGYWILTTIIMVRQSSYVATRSRVWQRAAGTLGGLLGAGALIALGVHDELALLLVCLLLPLTLTLVQIHHGWTTAGATLVLMLAFEYLGLASHEVLLARMLDTLIGCSLIFLAYRFLWPQWQGGRQAQLRKTALAYLHRYLQLLLARLAGRPVEPVHLARSRRLAYEQGVALTASLTQMKQEPGYGDAEHSTALLALYKSGMGHLNAILPQSQKDPIFSSLESQRLEALFDSAYGQLSSAMSGGEEGWSQELVDGQQWLHGLLQECVADRRGFAVYQLSLFLERYQAIHGIVKTVPPKSRLGASG
ncbi:FUSC family protein [Ferrimonas pelagia]|uniref:YccS/YhfK family putative transporter n=1 Tax=Ferrimonas pelagia TaxID=1177826 RepID=A0ABP9EDM7_9GAMM